METLFISDLHLSPERPTTVEHLLYFLGERARRAKRLYILGDLFDAWIGDDDDAPLNLQVRAALRALTASGVACALMHGNRDFLMGRDFFRDTGCQRLTDPTLIDCDGEPTLLMHGDRLCTDDLAYQRFRRRVRNPLIKRLFLWHSLTRRRTLAAEYRLKSGAANALKPTEIMDANPQAVIDMLQRHSAVRLIHGHTHRPADHTIRLAGRQVIRSVLAEWLEERGEVLVHTAVSPAMGMPGTWRREAVIAGRNAFDGV